MLHWKDEMCEERKQKEDLPSLKINITQRDKKFRLCGNNVETIKLIISECSKLQQRGYKTRHGSVGKLIDWEIVYGTKILLYNLMVYAQTRIHPEEWDA